jgi:bacterioferritin (cytochrome b1)
MTFRPMKPETILRRARERADERLIRRRETVARIAEVIARHKAKGDLVSAALFAELLVDAQDRLNALEELNGEDAHD